MIHAWQVPRQPLRASVAATSLAGLMAVVGLALAAQASLPIGALYPLKAGTAFGVCMLIAVGFLCGRHPFARFGPGNQVTTARVVLVSLVAGLIGEAVVPVLAASAAVAAIAATLLDGADGWFARRSRMSSAFGARFDMEIDAALIMVLAILAWRFDKAGAWVLCSGLLRYLFVAAGWLFAWLRQPLGPSRRRQAICVVQVVSLAVTIVPMVTSPVSSIVAAVALAALAYSFLVDILLLWRSSHLRGVRLPRPRKASAFAVETGRALRR